jgi:hypothetical protein
VLVEQSVNIALALVDHAYFMEKGESAATVPPPSSSNAPILFDPSSSRAQIGERESFLRGTAQTRSL